MYNHYPQIYTQKMELGTQRKAKHYNYWLGIVSESSFKVYG